LSVDCPDCGASFAVKPERAGLKVACKICGAKVLVPEDATALATSTISRTGSTTRRASSRKQPKGSPGLLVGLGVGGGVGAIGIIVVLVMMSRGGGQPAAPASDLPAQTAEASDAVAVASPATAATPMLAGVESPAQPEALSNATAAIGTSSPMPPTTAVAQVELSAEASTTDTAGKPDLPSATGAATKMELPDLIALVEPSVVRINVVTSGGGGTGSGFLVDQAGTIVTNYHVVQGAVRAEVELTDGTTANVTGFRHLISEKDIAIIDIDLPSEKLKPVAVAESLPQKGIDVAAFGAPLGLSFTASNGIVSALRTAEQMLEMVGEQKQGDWIQTTAPISHGNSGGPLVDMYGRVVAMNTLGFDGDVGQNLNFAISCVDIRGAIAEAPSKIQPLKPDSLPPPKTDGPLSGDAIVDEVGTPNGAKLFADLKEIALINARRRSSFDPTGAIWERVILRSQTAIEKSGIELSFGEPAPDAALMIVHLELKPTRKGTAGTQELVIKTELICIDPFAKRAKQAVRVWKGEDVVGTIALEAALAGQVPRTADTNLAKFFQSFRTAFNKAQRDAKAAAETTESGKSEQQSVPPKSP